MQWNRKVIINLKVHKSPSAGWMKKHNFYCWNLDGKMCDNYQSHYTDKDLSYKTELYISEDAHELIFRASQRVVMSTDYEWEPVLLPKGKDIYEINWIIRDAGNLDAGEVEVTLVGDYEACKNEELKANEAHEYKKFKEQLQAKITISKEYVKSHAKEYFKGIGKETPRKNYEAVQNQYHMLVSCKDELEKLYAPDRRMMEDLYFISQVEVSDYFWKPVCAYEEKIRKYGTSVLFRSEHYGMADETRLRRIRQLQEEKITDLYEQYDQNIKEENWYLLPETDCQMAYDAMWSYAMKKPYVLDAFTTARHYYQYIFKSYASSTEILLAELYAKYQAAGSNGIAEMISKIIKNENPYEMNTLRAAEAHMWAGTGFDLHMLASGLMWMKAYREENMLLQHMLKSNIALTEKEQERLHILSVTGGDAPDVREVRRKKGRIHFDVEALSWKETDYAAFFDNLAFQDRKLDYLLAVRDENQELKITQKFTLPDDVSVSRKMQDYFEEEYGDMVHAEAVESVVMSGSGEELLNGILVTSDEVKMLGIYVHTTRIGKKLNIKFYTLYMPQGGAVEKHRQQAVSMCKKLSPTVTTWESSLKESILAVLEQILNAPGGIENVQSGNREEIMF